MNYKSILAAILFCCAISTQGQVTDPNNLPTPGNWVGFNGNSIIPLPIQNIGDPRINISSNTHNKFRITELPTWNGLNFLSRTDVQRTTTGLQGETNTGWSLLHLWSGDLTGSMQRDSASLIEDAEDSLNERSAPACRTMNPIFCQRHCANRF